MWYLELREFLLDQHWVRHLAAQQFIYSIQRADPIRIDCHTLCYFYRHAYFDFLYHQSSLFVSDVAVSDQHNVRVTFSIMLILSKVCFCVSIHHQNVTKCGNWHFLWVNWSKNVRNILKNLSNFIILFFKDNFHLFIWSHQQLNSWSVLTTQQTFSLINLWVPFRFNFI